jgi:hypothetical protein
MDGRPLKMKMIFYSDDGYRLEIEEDKRLPISVYRPRRTISKCMDHGHNASASCVVIMCDLVQFRYDQQLIDRFKVTTPSDAATFRLDGDDTSRSCSN